MSFFNSFSLLQKASVFGFSLTWRSKACMHSWIFLFIKENEVEWNIQSKTSNFSGSRRILMGMCLAFIILHLLYHKVSNNTKQSTHSITQQKELVAHLFNIKILTIHLCNKNFNQFVQAVVKARVG